MAKSVMQQHATANAVVEIRGAVDDADLAAVLGTAATRDEVMEAYTWLSADDDLHRERHSAIHGMAAKVNRILERGGAVPA